MIGAHPRDGASLGRPLVTNLAVNAPTPMSDKSLVDGSGTAPVCPAKSVGEFRATVKSLKSNARFSEFLPSKGNCPAVNDSEFRFFFFA
jgi:hypothetical protein